MNIAELSHNIFFVLGLIFALAFKVLFVLAIYYNAESRNSLKTGAYAGFAMVFPIATGIVCLFKLRNIKDKYEFKKSIFMFILAVAMLIGACLCDTAAENNNWYDSQGNGYQYSIDVTFYDEEGNSYNYDFNKSGYDLLYINGTDEILDSDLCYLDTNGMLFYDQKMDIVVKDDTSCVDSKGNIYYPVNHVTFNKDGSIEYNYPLRYYDAVGNAYTYRNIPYIDAQGNKYYYSYNDFKGTYTNVITGDAYENEYCFVDENGYFVYDDKHTFVKQEDSEYAYQYKDDEGNIYYWASGVTWDENSQMHDAYDKVIQ